MRNGTALQAVVSTPGAGFSGLDRELDLDIVQRCWFSVCMSMTWHLYGHLLLSKFNRHILSILCISMLLL